MNRPVLVLWITVIASGASLLIAEGRTYGRARSDARRADHQARAITRQTAELAALHAALPAWTGRTPSVGLAPRISDSLATCGLPPAVMQHLSTQPGVSVNTSPGAVIKRRVASVTLMPVTLPELGKFLEFWRASEPDWIVSTIDLAPLPAAAAESRDIMEAAARIRAVLSIEALSVEQTGATP